MSDWHNLKIGLYPTSYLCEPCTNLGGLHVNFAEPFPPSDVYSLWDNYFEYVCLVSGGNFAAFIFFWALHRAKAAGVVPYRGPGQGSTVRCPEIDD